MSEVEMKDQTTRPVRPPRKLFFVLINGKEYDVFDIEGKEHHGLNDTPKSWWVYHTDRLPEGTLPPPGSENWEPWDVSIQRHIWDIRIKQKTTTKEKWGATQFRNHTSVEIWCNNRLFYSFGTTGGDRGISFAFAKIQYLQTALSEHSFNFYDPESERGRKIYWYGLPATLIPGNGDAKWEISVKPDYTNYPKEEWWKEYKRRQTPQDKEWAEIEVEDNDREEQDDIIRWGDAYSDQYIGWFRKDTDIK